MSDAVSRRDFFTKEVLKLFFKKGSTEPFTEEENRRQSLADYFKSPLYSYPLLQEMPWDFLLAEAKAKGISVEGRTKNDIARDVFQQINETKK